MRLLNTKTLQLEEFVTDIPPYAILSHTWEKEEVTFHDLQNLETARTKSGYAKLWNACARALRYRFNWIWIDSCCINKESSAELSEAINSMYQYYEDAAICYVYLCDVSSKYPPRNPKSDFRESRWFSRGWTLQELLAPLHVVFLDKAWKRIGTRWSLRDVVSAVTTIPVGVFEGRAIDEYSVAQRMSWAAFRETTRPEDEAYCLMGMFGVSLPPIYGEGSTKAFIRLQQEIIKISDDRSIFAWVAETSQKDEQRGLLAKSPYEFRMSGEVMASKPDVIGARSSYSFANNGLRIHLPLEPTGFSHDEKSEKHVGAFINYEEVIFLASLLCESVVDGNYLSVYLRKTGEQCFVRCHSDEMVLRPSPPTLDNVCEVTVRENATLRRLQATRGTGTSDIFHVILLPSAQHFVCAEPRHFRGSKSASVDLHRLPDISLVYDHPGGESFILNLDRWGSTPSFYLQQKNTIRGTVACRDHPHVDSILGQLDSGDYISVNSETRGDFGINLEVDYIPKHDPNIEFLSETLRPPELGFIVPLNLELFDQYRDIEIFPSDLFGREISTDVAYVTIFHTENGLTSFSHCPFRIVTYKLIWYTIHVAFGVEESVAWTDIILQDDQSKETSEEVWKSYLDYGSRAERRLNGQTSSSVSAKFFISNISLSLTASVEKRTKVQLGSHLLCLESKQEVISRWLSE
ncbi:hypothetical protein D9758_006783 [Tetrapyrgos nigripes]|uniref:HET-domain-containing protein n=1 Tax=Tetrapyrgos nigripes TaxID=182062 RepID=A0A8H5CX43_9AGAR|nr:hypothetical protein D9758_006783 [Tetrapyrgos nigripes]